MTYCAAVAGWLLATHRVPAVVDEAITLPAQFANLGLLAFTALRVDASATRRRAWRLALTGTALGTAGTALWTLSLLPDAAPPPLAGTLLYVASYPFIAAGMASFYLDAGGSLARPRVWFDIAAYAIALLALSWTFVLEPTLGSPVLDFSRLVVDASYCVGFAIFGVLAGLLYSQALTGQVDRPVFWLVATLLANLAGDMLWEHGAVGGAPAQRPLFNVAYLVADALLAIAATVELRQVPRMANRAPAQLPTSYVPALSILVAVAVLLARSAARAQAASAALVFLCLGALVIAAREVLARQDVRRAIAERVARESELRLGELLRHTIDAIVVTDATALITFVSPAAERVFGPLPVPRTGMPADQVFGPAHAARLRPLLDSVAAGRARATIDILDASAERATAPLVLSAMISAIGSGSDRQLLLTVRDVTDRQRAAAVIDRLRDEQRSDLSQRVHEQLAQRLAGVSMSLAALGSVRERITGDAQDLIRDAVDQLGASIGEARGLAANLSPLRFAAGSLPVALEHLAARLQQTAGVTVRLHGHGAMAALGDVLAERLLQLVEDAVLLAPRPWLGGGVDVSFVVRTGGTTVDLNFGPTGVAPGEDLPSYLAVLEHRLRPVHGVVLADSGEPAPRHLSIDLPFGADVTAPPLPWTAAARLH